MLQIMGFKAYFNSAGVGKGLAIYCKATYTEVQQVKHNNYQMSSYLNILNIYRSSSTSPASIGNSINDIQQLVEETKPTLIVGDFDIALLRKMHILLMQNLHH